MDQSKPSKRHRRPRGKRGQGEEKPAAAEDADECEPSVTPSINIAATPVLQERTHHQPRIAGLPAVTVGNGSRGASPLTDERASVISNTSSSAALQHLKERSRDEHERRSRSFLRLEAEKEASHRLDVAMSEQHDRDELVKAAKASLSVLAVVTAQRRATGNLFLLRQYAQQCEEVEDAEKMERDELDGEELESLGGIVTRMTNSMPSVPRSGLTSVGTVSPIPDDDASNAAYDVLSVTPASGDDFLTDEATTAFHELRSNAPSGSTHEKSDSSSSKGLSNNRPTPPTAPRTAESICPCSMM